MAQRRSVEMDKLLLNVFDHWNSQEDHSKWRKHKFFTPGMKESIKLWIKEGYSVDYLCESIDNYYFARTTEGSWWCDKCKYCWPIEVFFKGGKNKEMFNWKRFEPEVFSRDIIFTKEHLMRKKMEDQAARNCKPKEVSPLTDWLKASADDPDNAFLKKMAERQMKREENEPRKNGGLK